MVLLGCQIVPRYYSHDPIHLTFTSTNILVTLGMKELLHTSVPLIHPTRLYRNRIACRRLLIPDIWTLELVLNHILRVCLVGCIWMNQPQACRWQSSSTWMDERYASMFATKFSLLSSLPDSYLTKLE